MTDGTLTTPEAALRETSCIVHVQSVTALSTAFVAAFCLVFHYRKRYEKIPVLDPTEIHGLGEG